MENIDNFDKAYNKSVELLNIRMHSAFELQQKLKRKGYKEVTIKEVLQKLTDDGLVNDEKTGESYIHSLISYKTFGYYGVKAKLLQKGFAAELISQLLEEHFTPDVEEQIAQKYLSKLLHRGQYEQKDRQKAAGGLQRKGFRSQVIYKVINRDWEDS